MRWLVLLLLLVNVALYAWNAGWLPAQLGVAIDGPRDPQRLQRQVNADAVRIVPEPASAPMAAASEVAPDATRAASAPGDGMGSAATDGARPATPPASSP